jgi:coenzyme PQQ synthesis protein D (PqqD)
VRGRPPERPGVRVNVGARRYRAASGVTFREIAGQSIVLAATGTLYTFAGSGGLVWRLIARGAPLKEAVDALARRYGIAPARAERDVLSFVRHLVARGLVRPRPSRRPRART